MMIVVSLSLEPEAGTEEDDDGADDVLVGRGSGMPSVQFARQPLAIRQLVLVSFGSAEGEIMYTHYASVMPQ